MTQHVSLSGRESLTGPVAPESTGGIGGSATAARLADGESGTDDPVPMGTAGPSVEDRSEHGRTCDCHSHARPYETTGGGRSNANGSRQSNGNVNGSPNRNREEENAR